VHAFRVIEMPGDDTRILPGGTRRYLHFMIAQLTKEQAAALHATGDRGLEVVDPDTSRVYVIVDGETHRQAMEALPRQQDREAIAQGLAEMEAGLGISVEESPRQSRDRLLARKS
jgi:hypothetical protein